MHSSRIGCIPSVAVAVCWGGSAQEGVSARGDMPGGVCPGGVCPGGCLPDTPLWTEWQTLVKTLPCRNYVADGNNWVGYRRHVSRQWPTLKPKQETHPWTRTNQQDSDEQTYNLPRSHSAGATEIRPSSPWTGRWHEKVSRSSWHRD